MADHLRALLRDVICGHLDLDLAGLADELLLAPVHAAGSGGSRAEGSGEQMLGDPGQAEEILDVFI